MRVSGIGRTSSAVVDVLEMDGIRMRGDGARLGGAFLAGLVLLSAPAALALPKYRVEAARFLLFEPPLPMLARPGYATMGVGAVALLPGRNIGIYVAANSEEGEMIQTGPNNFRRAVILSDRNATQALHVESPRRLHVTTVLSQPQPDHPGCQVQFEMHFDYLDS